MKILVTAGGTGGHVFPALSVIQEILTQDADHQVLWVGTKRGIESTIVPNNDLALETIDFVGIRGTGLRRIIAAPFLLIRAIYQALKVVKRFKPRVVVGFGGYVTVPVCIACKILQVPIVIHEQNAILGLGNRLLHYMAKYTLSAYPLFSINSSKYIVVGNPIRHSIINVGHNRLQCKNNDSSNHKLRVLVLGGSLGASIFNQIMPSVFSKCSNIMNVTHQAGSRADIVKIMDDYKFHGIKANVVSFIDDMARVYDYVDLVICRSGALSVSEVSASALAAIFIPYPYATDNHQWYNAEYLVNNHASLMLTQDELSVDRLSSLVSSLSKLDCIKMGTKAYGLMPLDGAKRIASYIRLFS